MRMSSHSLSLCTCGLSAGRHLLQTLQSLAEQLLQKLCDFVHVCTEMLCLEDRSMWVQDEEDPREKGIDNCIWHVRYSSF